MRAELLCIITALCAVTAIPVPGQEVSSSLPATVIGFFCLNPWNHHQSPLLARTSWGNQGNWHDPGRKSVLPAFVCPLLRNGLGYFRFERLEQPSSGRHRQEWSRVERSSRPDLYVPPPSHVKSSAQDLVTDVYLGTPITSTSVVNSLNGNTCQGAVTACCEDVQQVSSRPWTDQHDRRANRSSVWQYGLVNVNLGCTVIPINLWAMIVTNNCTKIPHGYSCNYWWTDLIMGTYFNSIDMSKWQYHAERLDCVRFIIHHSQGCMIV